MPTSMLVKPPMAPAGEILFTQMAWHYLPTTWIKGNSPHDEIPVILVIRRFSAFFFGIQKTAGPEPPRERPPDPSARHSESKLRGSSLSTFAPLMPTCDVSLLKIHFLLNPRNFRQEYVIATCGHIPASTWRPDETMEAPTRLELLF